MQNIKIDPLCFSDFDAVLSLWQACDGNGLHLHHDVSETPQGFSLFLNRNPGLSFVARDGKDIVGAVLGSHDGRRGFINHLAVAQSYRRKGIGRALARSVIDAIKAGGIPKIVIFILKNNPDAQAFWLQLGFAREDIIDTYSLTY
ncbi:MAG: GNAT family N-acetyltransferase [Thermodesulfobacteriota bacterium]|nr:GNAT family N-acetyltransferase [Thermodesulfobacteriota bacterium]